MHHWRNALLLVVLPVLSSCGEQVIEPAAPDSGFAVKDSMAPAPNPNPKPDLGIDPLPNPDASSPAHDTGTIPPEPGSSGQPCLPNNTCEGDLLCYNGKCKEDHTAGPGMIIDGHMHFDMADLPKVDQLVQAMNDNGVDRSVLFPGCNPDHGGPAGDDAVWAAYEKHPGKFWPCLDAFDPSSDSAETYVENQLKARNWRCIGEVYLRQSPDNVKIAANHASMMKVYALAAKYDIPVFIHFEPDFGTTNKEQGVKELREVVEKYPTLQVVWLHGCNGEFSSVAAEYDNLSCVVDGNQEDPYPEDSLGVGTDIGCNGVMLEAPDGTAFELYVDAIRTRLAKMPDAQRFKIGYERLWDLMAD